MKRLPLFFPVPGAVPGLELAKAALGVLSTKGALKSGLFRARRVLEGLGFTVTSVALPDAERNEPVISAFWVCSMGKGCAWLDLRNDVKVKDVRQGAAENLTSVDHMKR